MERQLFAILAPRMARLSMAIASPKLLCFRATCCDWAQATFSYAISLPRMSHRRAARMRWDASHRRVRDGKMLV